MSCLPSFLGVLIEPLTDYLNPIIGLLPLPPLEVRETLTDEVLFPIS